MAINMPERTIPDDWYQIDSLRRIARCHDKPYDLRYSRLIARNYSRRDRFSLLEIGCGYGELFKALYHRDVPVSYVGFDPDPYCIEEINALGVRQCVGELGDSTKAIEYAKGHQIDVIVSNLSLGLWSNPIRDLTSLIDLLEPGAELFVIDLLRSAKILLPGRASPLVRYKVEQYNCSLTFDEVEGIHSVATKRASSELSWLVDSGNQIKEVSRREIANQPPFTTLFSLKMTGRTFNGN